MITVAVAVVQHMARDGNCGNQWKSIAQRPQPPVKRAGNRPEEASRSCGPPRPCITDDQGQRPPVDLGIALLIPEVLDLDGRAYDHGTYEQPSDCLCGESDLVLEPLCSGGSHAEASRAVCRDAAAVQEGTLPPRLIATALLIIEERAKEVEECLRPGMKDGDAEEQEAPDAKELPAAT